MNKSNMHKYIFYFPDDIIKELRKLSEETGAPMAELLRRAARKYLDKRKILDKASN